MAITPLPDPPSRQDPANFSGRADAMLSALPGFVTEINELEQNVTHLEESTVSKAAEAFESNRVAALSKAAAAESEHQAGLRATNAMASAEAAAADRVITVAASAAAQGNAAAALAIYGDTSTMQAKLDEARGQAAAAQSAVSSAGSILQQDLTAIAAVLHRAIPAASTVTGLFIYDTSKDSDGGAWVDKCGATSWMNEPLCGAWLGSFATELLARGDNLFVQPEDLDLAWIKNAVTVVPNATLAPDGTLTADFVVPTAGVAQKNIGRSVVQTTTNSKSISAKYGGVQFMQINWVSGFGGAYANFDIVNGTITAQVGCVATITPEANGFFRLQATATGTQSTGSSQFAFVETGTSTRGAAMTSDGVVGTYLWGAKQGSANTPYAAESTRAGKYFQNEADGKFYRFNSTYGATEVFRGNKAKFPRLAGLVVETFSVTIYDLTEPGRPMWMRFVRGGTTPSDVNMIGVAGTTLSCVAMLNGKLVVGVVVVDFPTDSRERFLTEVSRYNGNIAERNGGKGHAVVSSQAIANATVSAVAMRVMSDAPVDPTTGLQRPTIAFATGGGVSVLKTDGTIVSSAIATARSLVSIREDGTIFHGSTGNPNMSYARKVNSLSAGFASSTYQGSSIPPLRDSLPSGVVGTGAKMYRSEAAGLSVVYENPDTPARGMVNNRSSDFNTGWMVGDIRRAFLIAIEVESSSAPELATAAYVTPTAQDNATNVISASSFSQGPGTSAGRSALVIPTVPGRTYELRSTLAAVSSGLMQAFARDGNLPGLGTVVATGASIGVGNSDRLSFVAVGAFSNVLWVGSTTGGTATISGISVKEVIPDRSVKAGRANIFGTLTKSAVAAAAQLVAFSGWNAVNYVQEAYSADLNFGTGEWTASAFVSIPAAITTNDLRGVELVTNGDFSSAGGWTLSGGGTAISGGKLTFTAASAGGVERTVATERYKCYEFVVVVDSISGGSLLPVLENVPLPGAGGITVAGTYRFPATNLTTDQRFALRRGAGTVDAVVSFTGLKELTPATILERSAATGPSFKLGVDATGKLVVLVSDGVSTRRVATPTSYNSGTFLKAEACYAANGTLSLRANGVEVASVTGAPLLTINNGAATLTIGNSRTLDTPFPGSIAMVRCGATVPALEQSSWAYQQERPMFRDGAAITLPSSSGVLDLTVDESTETVFTSQAGFETSWSGLVRTNVLIPSAGTFSKVEARGGVKLSARATTSPGVDLVIPAYGLREELVKRGERAAQSAKKIVPFDFDAVAAQTDFVLPAGFTARAVMAASVLKREGTTKDFIRLNDGFLETIRFAVAPGAAAWVQIQAVKE